MCFFKIALTDLYKVLIAYVGFVVEWISKSNLFVYI